MEYKVLIIEDDKEISTMVKSYLVKDGFNVMCAFDGEEGLRIFGSGEFDLILLDIMLPKIDGMEVMRRVREKSKLPILIMSARDTDVDKAVGLGLGADDYIAKPFSMIEISARIKASIRRAKDYSKTEETIQTEEIHIKDLVINKDNFEVLKNGRSIKLTLKEFEILRLFAENPNRVFTKEQIYGFIWQDEYYGDENVINVHMRRLREKIEEDASSPKYIKTIWGIGYKLEVN